MTDPLLVFTPSGKRGRFPKGTPVLAAARQLGVDIDSVCGGRAICGRCQVTVAEGSFPKHGLESAADHLGPTTATETRFDERKGLAPGRRLSCQATLEADALIDVPPESQVHKQVVRKRAEVRDIQLDPVLRLHYVEVAEPDMHDARGDFERLKEALRDQWGLTGLTIDLKTLQALQKKLRAGDWKLTAIVHDKKRIIATRPGFFDKAYGIAIDIGSTTIAAHLCDLQTGAVLASSGMMNPQIRFGEDLMSRVSYVMMHKGGDAEMTDTVRGTLNALFSQLAAEAMIDANDIFELVFVGNPVMHHLLLGIDPTELGGAPFALATDSAIDLYATEIGLTSINDSARVYTLPCIAGHVGADTAGVLLSEGPHLQDEMMLVVDVGTNAEIVLGNRRRLLACSSPTGPAFEGAQLTSGQRAAPGAIERVRIDKDTLEPRFTVIGTDYWSDEDGFARATRRSGVTGICGSGIIEAVAEMYLAGIIDQDGVIDGSLAARSTPHRPGRPHLHLHPPRRRGRRAAHQDHPDRHPRHPARQGRPLCRLPPAHGPPRDRHRRPHHARRRLRLPHRPQIRPHPRPRPRLPARQAQPRRQRRRHRRAHSTPQHQSPPRDRNPRPPHRENRNRDRAQIPRPLRRSHGHPAQDSLLPRAGKGGRAAEPQAIGNHK